MIALALTLVPLALTPLAPVQLDPHRQQGGAAATPQPKRSRAEPAAVLGETRSGETVGLFYYRPTSLDPLDVVQTLSPVHGRTTRYVDPSTDEEREVPNLRTFGDLLVLVETLDRVDLVLQTIRGLESEADPETSAGATETLHYRPRFTSIDNLLTALRPLEHKRVQGNEWVSSITTTQEGTALIVRDSPSAVRTIADLLAQVDRPAPQVLLSAWVLQAGSTQATELPTELTSELARLLPYEHYDGVAMGLVRAAIKPRTRVHIDLQAPEATYRLELTAGAYDAQTDIVSFDMVQFSSDSGLRFGTATSIEPDRYTVLGAAGSPTLFVVLHAAPMKTAAAGETGSGAR